MEACLGSPESLILLDHGVDVVSLHAKLTVEINT
mgnify:CR=1 FL=1